MLGAAFLFGFALSSLTTAHSAEVRPFQKKFGEWITECEIDRMTDKETCSVTSRELGPDRSHRYVVVILANNSETGLEHHELSAFIHGDGGLTGIPSYRVDKNPAVEGGCGTTVEFGGAVVNGCALPVPADQLQNGSMMLIRVYFFDNTEYEHDLSLIDMRKAVEAMEKVQ